MNKQILTTVITAVGTGIGVAAWLFIKNKKATVTEETPSMSAHPHKVKLQHMFAHAPGSNGHAVERY